jgi:hypothetical protein
MALHVSSPLDQLLSAEQREFDRRANKRLRQILKSLPPGKQVLICTMHPTLQQGIFRIYLLRALKELKLLDLLDQVKSNKLLTVHMLGTPQFRPAIGEDESLIPIYAARLNQEMARAVIEFMEKLDEDNDLLAWRRYRGWYRLNFIQVILLAGDMA